MRFCTNCGASIADANSLSGTPDSSSVETLSLPVNPQTAPTNWPNFAESYKAPTPPVAEAKKSKTGLIISIIAAVALFGVLLVAGGIGYYYYTRSDGGVANGNNNQGVYNSNLVDDDANANSSPTPKASPSPTPSPTPAQLFTPPTEPTKDGTFTIYANEGWQLSQIAVVPEEKYTTTVEGIVDLAGAKAGIRAGGTKEEQYKSRRLFPEWPTGALLMRTRYADGRFSNTLPVSASGATGYWENLPDERGMLEFRINDNSPANNGGQFTIRKKHTSVPKKKS
jgi:hypothetical protein